MNEQLEQFWNKSNEAEGMILATAADDRVTMRTVSPVVYQEAILIFTSPESLKYQQLQKNPNCSFAIDNFFVEGKAKFYGSTMLASNEDMREVYAQKYADAFDESEEFGGMTSEFILLKPSRLKAWMFEQGKQPGVFEWDWGEERT